MPDLRIEHAPQPRPTLIRLRVAAAAAADAAQRLGLPTEPCTASFGEPDRLWLAPDQWLIASSAHSSAQLLSAVAEGLGSLRHHAVDSSAALVRTMVGGQAARVLLAMGCGVDFAPHTFDTGRCVRTRFARIPVIIVARGSQHLELIYDRSYRKYVPSWLERAATDPVLAA